MKDYWQLEPENNSTKLENCLIFENSSKECIKCIDNYFVEDGTCVTVCTDPNVVHLKEIKID